jgi:hypothetical protein
LHTFVTPKQAPAALHASLTVHALPSSQADPSWSSAYEHVPAAQVPFGAWQAEGGVLQVMAPHGSSLQSPVAASQPVGQTVFALVYAHEPSAPHVPLACEACDVEASRHFGAGGVLHTFVEPLHAPAASQVSVVVQGFLSSHVEPVDFSGYEQVPLEQAPTAT